MKRPVLVVVAALAALAFNAAPGVAAAPAAGWTISSVAEPSDFSATHDAACEEAPEFFPPERVSTPCDSYRIVVRNIGSVASSEPLTITDTLPNGVEAVFAVLEAQQAGSFPSTVSCSTTPVKCEYPGSVPPGGLLIMTVNVKVSPSASSSGLNAAVIEGGGITGGLETSAPTTGPNPINGATPAFAIEGFDLRVDGLDGTHDPQAGDHPYGVTTSFATPTVLRNNTSEFKYQHLTAGKIKEVVVDLPPGLVGDPRATPRCPLTALRENYATLTSTTNCPTASRIGTATFLGEGSFHTSNVDIGGASSIFNMTPETGYPAEFGFSYLGNPVLMYASPLPSSSGYGLRVTVPGLVALPINGVSLTFFGDPAAADGGATSSTAFLTNPTACSGSKPLTAKIEADSWEEPTRWVSAESTVYPEVTGCDMLQFEPTVQVAPEETHADTPSGYEVDLKVPQLPNVEPYLATPELKDASIALPEGVSVSPGAADGLVGCQERGPEGIELGNHDTLGHEVQEGEEPGAGGLPRAAHGHCPPASQIGTVQLETPLLPAHALTGRVYVAQPRCGGSSQPACTQASATNGELYGLYLEIEGEGVIVKLKGSISANPMTGQLTTTFKENPQLPFTELKLHLDGGPRAALANPQTCGTATTTSDLTPWSTPATPDAEPSSSFGVTGCGASMGFAPSFTAGTVTPIADGFSPFTLTFSRNDGEQDLSGLTVTTPPGLLGVLKSVVQCPEPQAQSGECGPQSLIGHTQAAAGAGSHPFWESGSVYLTGPYNGAPFGLSIVVPAIAGPFNLGNVIVRAAIHVDQTTGALTVVSDPLPQIRDGVPFRLKTVNVTVDRPEFIFNPTNCKQQQITATIAAAQGGAAHVSSPFAVTGCKNLPFKPKFTVLTDAKTSKAKGAYLHVKVTSGPGQANIGAVKVDLPKQLPSRLSTLQKACVAAVFAANPANCPAGSVVGTATAVTPLLKNPLTGPAYLVSHGGAAFPDLEIVLQGEGITFALDSQTHIKNGITSSTFKTVPDAPISTFDLVLPEGPHSVLAAFGSLCKGALNMPTAITGQNGAVIKQNTKIAVTGCPKVKAKKVTKRHKAKKGHKAKGSAKRGRSVS
jgi:hypothetical protein